MAVVQHQHITSEVSRTPGKSRRKFIFTFSCFLLFTFHSLLSAAQESVRTYLSGTGKDDTVNWDFYCTAGSNSGKWSTIAVPSCWELQGFGKYDYGFAKDSLRGKEQGIYRRRFFLPADHQGKQVDLVFEGVMTDAAVKVNGTAAGPIHQGAFYAFRYNITPLLKWGDSNLLEVTVSKHSANASVNEAERKADYWIFGGIFRPVYLESHPDDHISQVVINAKADGRFTAQVSVTGKGEKVGVRLTDRSGAAYGPEFFTPIASGKAAPNRLFAAPRLWTAETPNLYTAHVTLYRNGKPVHSTKRSFGFRTVEVRQRDGIYVNGVKVKMKGVNRHSFHPESGRTTSKMISIQEALLIKDMNMNAVRMAHYPPDDHFLNACDSLGLYVIDELAGWHGNYDTPTGTALLKEMIDHDVNHPSIILWANGNEGGHNFDLDPWFSEFDLQKRSVIHPWQLFNGIETQHYREYNYGIGNYEAGREIVMPTEFLHGQFDGGHGAGLEDYWEKMWNNPLSAGGFLWDFTDQAVVRRDKRDSLDTDKHRGADGILGPYHQKEGSYYTIKEVWSPIRFNRQYLTPTFDGKLYFENRYHFTNASQCRFSFELKDLVHGRSVTRHISSPSVKPGGKGSLQLDLPANWQSYDVLYLKAEAPGGKELFTWSYPLQSPPQVREKLMDQKKRQAITLRRSDTSFVVSTGDLVLRFHQRTGSLLEARNSKGVVPLSNGPVLQEAVNNYGEFSSRFVGDTLYLTSAFDKRNNYNTLQWKVYPTGIVKMEVSYFPSAYFTWFNGVNFSLPEGSVTAVEYMGDGPYRVWKNRMKGNRFGIWKKTYNNTETGESWNYPEFKGYHSSLYWCRFLLKDQSFTVYTDTEDLFLRLFTPAYKTDQWHNYEPIFPEGDISFMQGISSIGSKTQRAETTGPMGMKNIFYDYEKDPSRALRINLYFDFRSTSNISQP